MPSTQTTFIISCIIFTCSRLPDSLSLHVNPSRAKSLSQLSPYLILSIETWKIDTSGIRSNHTLIQVLSPCSPRAIFEFQFTEASGWQEQRQVVSIFRFGLFRKGLTHRKSPGLSDMAGWQQLALGALIVFSFSFLILPPGCLI